MQIDRQDVWKQHHHVRIELAVDELVRESEGVHDVVLDLLWRDLGR